MFERSKELKRPDFIYFSFSTTPITDYAVLSSIKSTIEVIFLTKGIVLTMKSSAVMS
jgi:hypothetical protein